MPPAASSNFPELLPDGSRERALLVAEQRTLDELLRDGGEVDGNKWRLDRARFAVNEAREEFLSRPALAEDQHGGRERCHFLHQLQDVAGHPARSDDEFAVVALGDLGAQPHDVLVQVLPFARVGHERSEPFDIEVLRDVVVGAETHRLDRGLKLLQRRDDDDFHVWIVLPDDLEHLEAADAGEAHVEEHDIDVLLVHHLETGLTRRRPQHAIIPLQDGGQRFAHPLVIVDNEHGFPAFGHEAASIDRSRRLVIRDS